MARTAEYGSRRTDADIFAQARKSLDDRPSIPATVRVHIEDGVAWLTGMARRMSERAEAEDVVRTVPGIQSVVNKISVAERPERGGVRTAGRLTLTVTTSATEPMHGRGAP